MPERVRAVGVHIEAVDRQTGLWCTRCNLSTGIRFWFALTAGGRLHLQERLWCYEHQGSRGVTVEQAPS